MAPISAAPGREYVLTLSCPDKPGIVYAVSSFLVQHSANILASQQYGESPDGRFFMRVHFQAPPGGAELAGLERGFSWVAEAFHMTWQLHDQATRVRTLIMVSRLGHCLNDLLFRWKTGLAAGGRRRRGLQPRRLRRAGRLLPASRSTTSRSRRTAKAAAEGQLLEVIDDTGADLIVLARYMQILSGDVCKRAGGPDDQHPPLLPAELQGRQALPPGARARRQAGRRDRALRDRRTWTRARSSSRT